MITVINKKPIGIIKKGMKNRTLLTPEQIQKMFIPDNVIDITDIRDIEEMNRRKVAKTMQPHRDELYSVNPSFNGVYTDAGRLTKDGKPMKGYCMGSIH